MSLAKTFPASAHVRLPKLRHHKPSGRAVVTLSGRDLYLGPFGTAEAQRNYEAAITEWLGKGRSAPAGPVLGASVAELAAGYREHAAAYYRHPDGTPTSEAGNIDLALRPLLALYPDLPAAEFSPLKLSAVRQRMVLHGHCRPKVTQHVGRIRRMFRWGVEMEIVAAAVFQALQAVAGLRAGRSDAVEPPPIRPVSDADVEATLPHLSSVVAAMVRVQPLCGTRPGEVCRMTAGEIDRQGEVWLCRPARHKGPGAAKSAKWRSGRGPRRSSSRSWQALPRTIRGSRPYVQRRSFARSSRQGGGLR